MARPRSKTGLEVAPRLPKGAIVKPLPPGGREPPLQVVPVRPRARCPYCGAPGLRKGVRGRIGYYACTRCADPETGDYTRFRVCRG